MPFLGLRNDEPPRITLRQVGPNAFQLLEGFRFQRPPHSAPRVLVVPAHDPDRPPVGSNQTDLASVPWFLWWFVSSYGQHTEAAILHDFLLGDQSFSRAEADLVFREALKDSGVSWVRRWVMWVGVTIGTLWDEQPLRAVLLLGHLAVVVWMVVLWRLSALPGWWPVLVGSVGLVWGRLWPWTVAAVVLLGPPTVLVWTTIVVVYCVELVGNLAGLARGQPFVAPKPVPYRRHGGG